MKAYGLATVLRNTFGLKTYVEEVDEDTNAIEIHSSLEPERLRALQEFAESEGWELSYRCSFANQHLELLEMPESGEEVS